MWAVVEQLCGGGRGDRTWGGVGEIQGYVQYTCVYASFFPSRSLPQSISFSDAYHPYGADETLQLHFAILSETSFLSPEVSGDCLFCFNLPGRRVEHACLEGAVSGLW